MRLHTHHTHTTLRAPPHTSPVVCLHTHTQDPTENRAISVTDIAAFRRNIAQQTATTGVLAPPAAAHRTTHRAPANHHRTTHCRGTFRARHAVQRGGSSCIHCTAPRRRFNTARIVCVVSAHAHALAHAHFAALDDGGHAEDRLIFEEQA